MQKIISSFFLIIFSFSTFLRAETSVVNEVLFSVAGKSATTRDRLLYETLIQEVFEKKQLSKFSKKKSDDFLLSRLSSREALVFDILGDKKKMTDSMRKKMSHFSAVEIENEMALISKALSIVELKENQLAQENQLTPEARFDAWLEVLKRKYQVKLKSNEMK
jgi:hypothetical protein